MVVLFHLAGPGVANHRYLINEIIIRGGMGVDLFFVLSGYIIHHVYGLTFSQSISQKLYLRFLSFRVARMYPVHVFTMGLMFILYFIALKVFHKTPPDIESYQFTAIVNNLLMTHAWFNFGSPNIPAWSISAEWFMYLLYPLCAMALFRLSLFCEYLMLVICLIAVYFLVSLHPLLHIVPEFIFGATLYQINSKLHFTKKLGGYTGLALIAAIGITLNLKIDSEAVYVLLFGFLILALTSENDKIGHWLGLKYCMYLGEISYSLYMIHSFVWSVIKNICRIGLPSIDIQGIPVVAMGIIASVIAAALVYTVIEVPSRRFLRHLTDPKDVMAVS